MLYQEKDLEVNRLRARREGLRMALCALPFLAAGVVAFALRREALAIAGFALACASAIFLGDLRLMPVVRYGRFLGNIFSGLKRETAGTLVRLGEEEIYEDGVYFRELILNIYEDMDEEGERRFLLERAKPAPDNLVGRDVKVTSHGSIVLAVEPMGGKEDA